MPHWSVYVLISLTRDFMYVGRTRNLKRRFQEHQQGLSQSTRAYRPYRLEVIFGLRTEHQAIRFEKYLKTGSGRAVLKKHFLSEHPPVDEAGSVRRSP